MRKHEPESNRSTEKRKISIWLPKEWSTGYSVNPQYFLAPEIFEGAYRQMIGHIPETLKGNGQ